MLGIKFGGVSFDLGWWLCCPSVVSVFVCKVRHVRVVVASLSLAVMACACRFAPPPTPQQVLRPGCVTNASKQGTYNGAVWMTSAGPVPPLASRRMLGVPPSPWGRRGRGSCSCRCISVRRTLPVCKQCPCSWFCMCSVACHVFVFALVLFILRL